MSDNKELDAVLLKQETKFRVESFLMKLGATEEAAKLIASSPDQLAKFTWDGVNLKFGKGDLTAVDDPAARAYFTEGAFKGLFAAPKADGNGKPQMDEALVASAKLGNMTARSILARDHFNSDVHALDAALKGEGQSDNKGLANGHDKSTSDNPFFKMRNPDGTVNKAIEQRVGGMIAAMGYKRVAEIAAAAKSPAAPLGLSLTGMPLKV